MSLLRPSVETETRAPASTAGARSGSLLLRAARTIASALSLLTIALALAFVGGYVWFAQSIANEEMRTAPDADGIVVLTGGTSRIADALELLAGGHGQRLLISGVHRTTSSGEIARLVPRYRRLIDCCVDLDHSAVNTVGNAAETRRWAEALRFKSLILVTSNYHMPRSMAELSRQMPDIRLIAFPVVSEKMRAEPWWSSTATAKLLFSEYLKYIVARLRMWLDPTPPSGVAGISGERRT